MQNWRIFNFTEQVSLFVCVKIHHLFVYASTADTSSNAKYLRFCINFMSPRSFYFRFLLLSGFCFAIVFLGCSDTPGWRNYHTYDCATYSSKNFCKNGEFLPGSEWTGSNQLDKRVGTGCASDWKAGAKTCADVYNHPERNCCACGKDTKPTIYQNYVNGL